MMRRVYSCAGHTRADATDGIYQSVPTDGVLPGAPTEGKHPAVRLPNGFITSELARLNRDRPVFAAARVGHARILDPALDLRVASFLEACARTGLSKSEPRYPNLLREGALPYEGVCEERRKDLVKGIKQMAEEARVRIRSGRRDGIDALKKGHKDGKVTEDNLTSYEKEIQKLTDGFVKKIDDAVNTKEAEILKV